jgi:hypothetical protein
MTRPVWSVDLSPRENQHMQHSVGRDILDICAGATLLFIVLLIVVLAFGGF